MISEERVRRMAEMAAYEAADGAADRKIMSYYRGDYLTKQVLITVFCSSAAFVLAAVLYAIYNFETLIIEIYDMDLRVLAMKLLTGYLVFIGGMAVITLAVYSRRYTRARKHAAAYYHDLRILSGEADPDGR